MKAMNRSFGKLRFYLRSKLPYVHIFMYITIACTFVLMISTIVLYAIFSRTMISEYGNQSANLLRKDAESMEFLLDWTLSYALQTRNDPVILPFVQWNYENDYLNYEVWRRLQNLMDNHPFISSIYLINGYNGNILDTRTGVNKQSSFYDADILSIIQSRKSMMSQMIVPRELYATVGGTERHDRLLSIVIPYDMGNSPSIFVMNIDSDSLNKMFGVSTRESLAQIDLMTDQHIVVSSTNPADFLKDLGGTPNMAGMNGDSNWYVSKEKGIDELVLYADIKFTQVYHWYIVVKLPLDSLNQQLEQLRNRTILIFLFILLLGIGIMWILSRKIYSPIRKLVKDVTVHMGDYRETGAGEAAANVPIDDYSILSNVFSKQHHKIVELSKHTESNRNHLKENFLNKLLTAGTNFSQQQLQHFFAEYKVNLPLQHLQLAILRIDALQDFAERYSIFDQSLLRMALSNIAIECLGRVRAESIDSGQDHVIVIFEAQQNREAVHRLLLDGQRNIREFLKLSVTVAISPETFDCAQLPQAYRTTLEATNERFKLGPGQLIEAHDGDAPGTDDYSYPEKAEKQLLIYLRQQKADEAYRELREFLNRATRLPYPECRLAVTHLIINLGKTLNSLKQESIISDIPHDWGISSIHDHLEHLESVEAIHQWLVEILSITFASAHKDVPASEYKDLIQQVFAIVDKHLFDPNLSSKFISDEVGLSVNYIRTMFKSTTNLSIIDYIAGKRLDYACELLLSSSSSVEEIASQTGFAAMSSFYTAFKKKYGITPAQFRKDSE